MHNFKKALSLLLVGAMSVGMFGACGKKDKEPEIPNELVPLTADDLEAGKYYVKNGDTFYALPSGEHNFDEKSATVKDSSTVDPKRTITFGVDDATIPTLYADDTLVYVTSELPDSFVWERYKDDGYSIGVTGLEANNTGSYSIPMDGMNFYSASAIKSAVAESEAEVGDTLVFDAIDGIKIGSGNVSEAGSILGLQYGKTYNVDVYDGSKYLQFTDIAADTHVFGAYEIYTSSICNYMQANYIQVVVPDNFLSGYYFINGTGFVKYVDNARSQGIADVDFNKAYYFTDEDGQVHTIEELGDDGVVVPEDEDYYSNITDIDCSNKSVTINVHYEDAKGVNVDGSEFTYSDEEVGTPQVKLIDPDGNEDYVFVQSNEEENTLTITVENPIPGAWETRVYNAEKRMFNISTAFVSGHDDTLVHNGNKGELVYYVPQSMNNAQFTITWSNETVSPEHDDGIIIKDNKVNDPDGKEELTFTRDSVTETNSNNYQEGRGEVKMIVGAIKYGDYKITLNSPYALGRVRVSVVDLDGGQVEQEESAPVEEQPEAE